MSQFVVWGTNLKLNNKSFGAKLWTYFAVFATLIFITLWLLQTVFLQTMYESMAVSKVRKNVTALFEKYSGPYENEAFYREMDQLAYSQSFLVLLAGFDGKLKYSASEHSFPFEGGRNQPRFRPSWKPLEKPPVKPLGSPSDKNFGDFTDSPGEDKSKPVQAERERGVYHNLPPFYEELIRSLKDDSQETLGIKLDRGSAYVYAVNLNKEYVLIVSMPIKAVGAAVGIIRMQLIIVSAAALLLGLLFAYVLSKRFSRPVKSLVAQSRKMAVGDFELEFNRGFCSELDELSDTLDQTAKSLDRLEHSRQELLANVSHDLRTPLTMIRGYAESVRDITGDTKSERDADVEVIIREADRLTDLVNDILEYTSVSKTGAALELKPLELTALIQKVCSSFDLVCRKEGIELETKTVGPMMVCADSRQIERVLWNLVDNAVRHSGDSRRIVVQAISQDNKVTVRVQDFGQGIPPEEVDKIWNRYFTARQRRSRGKSGLGLAIVKEILVAHNAKFGVESQLGSGTVFWFTLAQE